MHLIACQKCGVVLNADLLPFHESIEDEENDCIDVTKAVWDGQDYVAFTRCPVCNGEILKP